MNSTKKNWILDIIIHSKIHDDYCVFYARQTAEIIANDYNVLSFLRLPAG